MWAAGCRWPRGEPRDARLLGGVRPHPSSRAKGGLEKTSCGIEARGLSPIVCWGMATQGVTLTATEFAKRYSSGRFVLQEEFLVSELGFISQREYTCSPAQSFGGSQWLWLPGTTSGGVEPSLTSPLPESRVPPGPTHSGKHISSQQLGGGLGTSSPEGGLTAEQRWQDGVRGRASLWITLTAPIPPSLPCWLSCAFCHCS